MKVCLPSLGEIALPLPGNLLVATGCDHYDAADAADGVDGGADHGDGEDESDDQDKNGV